MSSKVQQVSQGAGAAHLTDEQLLAVHCVDGPALVSAGAGTGKSTLLLAKANLIRETCPETRILLISFTRKAVKELTERLGESRNIKVCTFHSLFWSILRQNGFSAFRIIRSEEYKLNILRGFIGEKDIAAEEVLRAFCAPGKAYGEVTEIVKNYQAWLLKNKLMDFDVMQIFCLELLQTNQFLRKRLQNAYRYILIDEAQDISPIQADITLLLLNKERNITLVGDNRQAIYSFRGTDCDRLYRYFREKLPEIQEYSLTQNHRNSKAILTLANSILADFPSLHKEAEDNLPQPVVCTADDTADEARFVLKTIAKLIKEGYGYTDVAVLFRTSKAGSTITEFLLDKGLPFTYSGYLWWEEKIFSCIFTLVDESLTPVNTFSLPKDLLLSEGALESLKMFSAMSVPDGIELLQSIGIEKIFGKEKLSFLSLLQEKAQDFPTMLSLREYIRELQTKYAKLKSMLAKTGGNALSLLTIHAAKGTEFKAVFLVGAADGVIPDTFHEDTDIEEERRLLYVAVTRARERLYISYPLQSGKSKEDNKPSRFLQDYFYV